MKIRRIDLDDDEAPETVTVELSHDEAVFLALFLGKQNGIEEEEVMRGGSVLGAGIYGALTGGVFNRFYEDGVDGAAKAARTRS
ncbi:hypothetical protein ACGFZS_47250 [Streptomyces sp. NPDC048288]|uniref:hypothetical protein n=1 Tax=Streptomyces sp. NPDC048288 TaxID=3365529 RepID=UPI003723151D